MIPYDTLQQITGVAQWDHPGPPNEDGIPVGVALPTRSQPNRIGLASVTFDVKVMFTGTFADCLTHVFNLVKAVQEDMSNPANSCRDGVLGYSLSTVQHDWEMDPRHAADDSGNHFLVSSRFQLITTYNTESNQCNC